LIHIRATSSRRIAIEADFSRKLLHFGLTGPMQLGSYQLHLIAQKLSWSHINR
jgi:hypothetical protein